MPPAAGSLQVCPEHGQLGLTREGHLPGEALVEQATERVQVRAPVNVSALDLLGSDVGERADEAVGCRRVACSDSRRERPKSAR